jgi:hypothetical protein
MFFKASVSPGCSGVCGKAVNTVTLCNSDPAATVLLWSVKDGKENAVIKGAANTDNIEVERKNNKAFTLTVKVTITCSCNLICAAEDELVIPESPDTKAPMCGIKMQEYAEPKMYGGLIDDYKMDKKEINRDDYIALGAEGKDFDILSLICEPVKPDCEDVQETKRINLNSSVRFEWNIINGNGSFVKIGRLPLNNINTDGDRVIFKPPYVTLPGKPLDTNSVVSNVILSVIDDNPGQAQDDRVDREITIITSRVKNKPDKYIVSVIPLKAEGKMPQPFKADSDPGTCHVILKEPPWTHLNNLKAPVIQLPNIPGSDTIVNGEWVILTVDDQDDTDSLIASCKSTGSVPPCSNNGIKLGYADKINYKWRITGKTADKLRGRFIKANGDSYQQVEEITAGTVIYEAPADLQDNDFVTVTIACNAFNPETDRTDNESPSGKITLRIYKGGVKLSPVPLAWLPESGNKVKLNSTLCVSDKKEEWETAPQHFARIHFFELTPVSNEKGICMNAPLLQNANECRDLKLSNDTVSHEAYDSLPIKTCPDNSNYFVKARSSIIEHDYAINVFSEDYGGYGYLTSYADIRSLQPETKTIKKANYSSIPLQKGEAKHPGSFVGKSGNRDGNFDFADNRVSIPQDLDKNNIADNGWTTGKQKIIDDPAFAITDDENIPVGDNYPGDGLTNYEEYRGFMTLKAVEPKAGETGIVSEPVHIRSNYQQKTLFIYCEPFELDIGLFEHISKLETYKLGQGHFIQPDKIDVKGEGISKSGVWLNFNFTQAENVVKQYGLFLKDYLEEKKGSKLMGKAFNISQKEKERTRPSPPNWEFQIRIYSTAITTFCADKKLNEAEKKKQVIAHELFHGCNVCHHGEAPGESTDFDLPRYGGLRSGDVNCVMRYDNMTDGKKFPANAPVLPEKTGDILCSSWAGTGYNKPDTNFVTEKITQKGMGDAALNRGACDLQIRISMRGGQPPECRQGEIRKIIGEYVKPK